MIDRVDESWKPEMDRRERLLMRAIVYLELYQKDYKTYNESATTGRLQNIWRVQSGCRRCTCRDV